MDMRWGLVPSWFKEDDPSKMQFKTSNCRSDTMLSKSSYKVSPVVCLTAGLGRTTTAMCTWQCWMLPLPWGSPDRILQLTSCFVSPPQGPLLKGKRCVVLADGFYEWQQCGGGKQPYFIYFPQSKKHPVLQHC